MLCLLGSEDCGVVCALPLVVKAGDIVRISNSVAARVIGGGSAMLGNTYRLLLNSGRYSFNGKWIPIFGVQIEEG